jgi:YVTN family beta-propeller protein
VNRRTNPGRLWRELSFVLACTSAVLSQQGPGKVIQQGISVEFDQQNIAGHGPARSGDDVRFRFRISDTASGNPLQGLKPAAWLDVHRPGQLSDTSGCEKKVAAFLGDNLLHAPSVDLNAWYVLAMNEDSSISVVNPLFGFGGSQLLTMVFLDSPAEDWALTDDQQTLFVSMPESKRVAVVDAATWKITARLDVPSRPGRLAFQPDEKYLWVSHASGVMAFDRQTLKPAGKFATGAGPHALAFSSDGRFVFAANHDAGTVSVIDTAEARLVATLPTGGHPVSVAYSGLSRTAYAANEDTGGIVAVNTRGEIVARIALDPGVRQVRGAPGGRFLFAVNPEKEKLYILDASSNRLVQTGVIHGGPDQVTFTSTLAYVRRRSDATVLMVPLDAIGTQDAPLPLVDFTGGTLPFSRGARPTPADSIVPVPGANAVLVANPADHAVYYYQEGMAAPMGQFQNYSHEPRAVMVVDRGLAEGPRGVYQTIGRVPQAGVYDVVFFNDSPRVVHCFQLEAGSAAGEPARPMPVVLQSVDNKILHAGKMARLRFQVLDGRTQKPVTHLQDLRALVFMQPGVWQARPAVTEAAPGIYEVAFTPPSSGIYQAYFQAISLGLKFNSPHVLTFTVDDRRQHESEATGASR